jgi:hypothetical protein
MMTDEDLRQMYVNMAERDADGSLDALKQYNADQEAAKKRIAGDTKENNSGQQKETDANST